MEQIIDRLKTPALTSSLITGGFIALELINRRSYNESFPAGIFITLWFLALAFFTTLAQLVRDSKRVTRTGNNNSFIRVILLFVVGWLWLAIVLDQMPCFLGVPLCD